MNINHGHHYNPARQPLKSARDLQTVLDLLPTLLSCSKCHEINLTRFSGVKKLQSSTGAASGLCQAAQFPPLVELLGFSQPICKSFRLRTKGSFGQGSMDSLPCL